MKTITLKTVATSLVAGLLLFSSCSKQGPVGPQGTPGLNGYDGNANVYGYKFSVDLSLFIGPDANANYQYAFNPASMISPNVLSGNDAVLMYLFDKTQNGADYYTAMPCNNYFDNTSSFNAFSFDVGSTSGATNLIFITIRNSSGAQPYSTMSGPISFKLVYIQSINHREKPKLPKDLSYASVKAFYHLAD